MTATALAPRPATRARRDAIAAAVDALGAMTDADLAALVRHGDSARVQMAALVMLTGRHMPTPAHPTAAEFVAAHAQEHAP